MADNDYNSNTGTVADYFRRRDRAGKPSPAAEVEPEASPSPSPTPQPSPSPTDDAKKRFMDAFRKTR